MRIYQNETYRKGGKFIRILRVERHEVEFRATDGDPEAKTEPEVLSKKEFCRLIRGMDLVPPVAKPKPE